MDVLKIHRLKWTRIECLETKWTFWKQRDKNVQKLKVQFPNWYIILKFNILWLILYKKEGHCFALVLCVVLLSFNI